MSSNYSPSFTHVDGDVDSGRYSVASDDSSYSTLRLSSRGSPEASGYSSDSGMDTDLPGRLENLDMGQLPVPGVQNGGGNGLRRPTVVSGGLTITNQNGGQPLFAAGVRTEVERDGDGNIVPKNVGAILNVSDNGKVKEAVGSAKVMQTCQQGRPTVGRVDISILNPNESYGYGGGGTEQMEHGQSVSHGGINPDSSCRPPRQGNGEPQPWPPEESFEVFVKNFDGKTYPLRDIRKSDTVESLMRKIQEKIGVVPAQQRLIYAGRNLYEGHKLSEYEVKAECTVHLQGRLRGGGGGWST